MDGVDVVETCGRESDRLRNGAFGKWGRFPDTKRLLSATTNCRRVLGNRGKWNALPLHVVSCFKGTGTWKEESWSNVSR